ncbi:MAG: glycosyltransferase family 2 protein [Mariprofundaceae bacterium]
MAKQALQNLTTPDVAAVVVTFRSRLLIDRCLLSLREAKVNEIWVVDNASDDGTADYIQSKYPEVNLIRSEFNVGFAAGNNLALKKSEADNILLLNPDAWLTPLALEKMVQVLESDSKIAVVGPSIDRQGEPEPSLLMKPRVFEAWSFLFSGMRRGSFSGRAADGFPWRVVTDGDHVRGSCMLLRRQAMKEVGLLDESFFLYFEETEWCLRFRKHGWRVVIAPDALAHHVGKASVKTQESLPSLEFMRSAILFWKKSYMWPLQMGLRLTLVLMACVKWLLLLPLSSAAERRGWLLAVAGLAINPFMLPIIYDRARRPSSWR